MAEKEPEDYSKLPLEDKLSHKVWRARLMGYEEAAKHFRRIDDEGSSEYSKFTGMIKGFVTDSNQMAQEKGVDAALAFVESASVASKVCSDVVAGIVVKCLNGRPKTKEGGILVCLMFIEIEQFATVQEEIMKGFTNKQPKIVAASVLVLNRALQEFGAKVINIKMLMKAVPPLFEHSDKNVRAEAKSLAVELFCWFGVAIKPTLEKHLKPVQLKELEEEWGKLSGTPPIPPRRLRSDQATEAVVAAAPGGDDGGEDEGSGDAAAYTPAALDPYDLADPVDMLGKMPKDFYEKVADPKWKERKEVLEAVLPLAQSIKLESGDYGELVKALKKVITKDSNVMVVALAGNIVTGLAKGLRGGFHGYASVILAGILEKFKEKKLNVVNSLRDAADAVYLTTALANVQEEVTEALNNKNPSVKSETLLFLCRCFQQCTPAMVPKPFLKALAPLIVQKLDDTNPQVREAGQETLGTLLRVVGDRPMNSYLENVDKGKMAKIQEHRESVSLKIQTGIIPSPMKGQAAVAGGVKKDPPKKAKPAEVKLDLAEDTAEPVKAKKKPAQSSQKKPPKKKVDDSAAASPAPAESKPAAAGKKKPAAGGGKSGGKGGSKGKAKGGAAAGVGEPPDPPEPNIASEEVEEKAKAVLPSGMLDKLADPKWKERLEACEQFKQFVEGLSPGDMQSLLFCKVLARKPGWKDSNFQVMNAKFAIVATLAEKAGVFGKKSTTCVLPALVDKFSDIKVKGKSGETLMILSDRMTLNYISLLVMKAAFEHKSPKVQSESLDWLGQALKAFGFLIKAKPHIDFIKKAFGASNPAVRTAAVNVIGVMHLYLGAQVRMFFEEEKPALLQLIDDAIAKVSGETAPAPTRGPNLPGEDDGGSDEEEEGGDDEPAAKPMSLADMMDKVDISPQIKPDLIKELADKNWKIRNESLQKVQEIIKTAKFIKPSLGDLPGALKGRLSDSNKKLIITTLDIIKNLSTAMGSGCAKFVKTFIPGVLGCLGDSNPGVRAASLETLNAWYNELTLAPMIEQELIANALSTESANLRTELLGWLQEKLPESGKLPAEVNLIIPPLYSCLEDRSGEVRKKANATVPVLISKIGYEIMVKEASKVKGSSKKTVMGVLEKHRSSAPPPKSKPAAAQAPAQPSESEKPPKTEKVEKATKKPGSAKTGTAKPGAKSTAGSKDKGSKKGGTAEVSAGPPLVFVPNGKEGRMRDEDKMKTLKWNFQSPRSEHIEQLKEQLTPCVSADLLVNLFHDDFKKHLAALATLTKCVSGSDPPREAAVGCTDVLLRWITLRFFDTNTTVNLKCLEFLSALFKMLLTVEDYRMSDYEAYAFLPYLVNKVGDSKEPVRKGVRALFREICSFYPPAKLFPFIVDGLKSKNARQRAECLEELGTLIQYNGMSVCGSQPQKTIPVIAHQITDRDNTVRSAALNAMVVVYGNTGEGVYKFTSQLSQKDVSLLDERIKRSGIKAASSQSLADKAPSQSSSTSSTQQQPQAKQPKFKAKNVPSEPSRNVPSESTVTLSQSEPSSSSKENTPPSSVEPPVVKTEPPPPRATGPFKYVPAQRLPPMPDPIVFKPLRKEERDLIYAPLPTVPQLQSRSMPNPVLTMTPTRQARTAEAINFIISQITSNDSTTCSKGIKQIEAIIISPSQRPAITPHVDQLLRALLLQMRVNFASPLTNAIGEESEKEVMEVAKTLTSCVVKVLEEPSLALLVSQDTLIELERDVVAYLTDERLLKLEDAAQLLRVFNYLMLRLCENCDKTSVYGSLLQLLAKSMSSGSAQSKPTELIMKCIWKLTKLLPQYIATINLDRLLFEIHQCFEVHAKHPSAQMDVPIRTVKTILFHLINSVGEQLLSHLTLIKESKHSQVTQYIQRTLKKKSSSLAGSSSNGMMNSQLSSGESLDVPLLPADLMSTFSEVLKKIGNPSSKRQGLRELYQLKQDHPQHDFEQFFKKIKISSFYRSYIERGLREVEQEMTGQAITVQDSSSTGLQTRHKKLEEVQSRASKLMEVSLEKRDTLDTSSTNSATSQGPSRKQANVEDTTSGLPKPKVDRSQYLEEMRKKLNRLKGTS